MHKREREKGNKDKDGNESHNVDDVSPACEVGH